MRTLAGSREDGPLKEDIWWGLKRKTWMDKVLRALKNREDEEFG